MIHNPVLGVILELAHWDTGKINISDSNFLCQLIKSCIRPGCDNADFDNRRLVKKVVLVHTKGPFHNNTMMRLHNHADVIVNFEELMPDYSMRHKATFLHSAFDELMTEF